MPAPVGQRATALLAPSLLLAALVATGCGSGDEVSTSATEDQLAAATTEAQDSASAGATATEDETAEDGTDIPPPRPPPAPAPPPGGAPAGDGAGGGAAAGSPPASAPATATADPAVVAAAQAGVAALNGTSWDAMYDISCQALLGGQSRADYVASFDAAGSPAELSGGPLAVGEPVDDAEVDDADLVAASGPVAWVEIVQADSGEVTGVARLVEEGGRWTFCGLGQ